MPRDVNTRVGVDDRASGKLRKASQEVSKYGRAWAGAARVSQRAMRLMDRGFARLRRSMGTLMRRAKFMMIGFQLTAMIMGVQMVRAALKYERALRNVTSLMAGVRMGNEEIERSFRSMDKSIRDIAVRTGTMPQDLAVGMYNVVSATFDGASGLNVLEAAAVGAFAGLSSVEATTGLLTKTLQAYREEGESNMDVSKKSMQTMDDYFMAVNRGMFTFDDLANKMGALPSTAAAFGVNLKDLLGFLSTATVRGVGLDEAITGVRQAMLQIGKLTPQTEEAAQQLFGANYEDVWGPAALAANGLYGTLQNLNEVLPDVPANILEAAIAMEDEGGDAAAFMAEQLGANVGALAALFPNIRALKAVLAVTGPGLALYGENMEFMADSAGAAGRAQEEMAKSAEGSLQFLKAAWETFKIDVGNIALPFIKTIADSMMNWWGGLPERFAEEGGLFDTDAWLDGVPDSQAEEKMKTAAADYWAAAAPGERIAFILRTAWTDAITNLTNWFETGGGREKITNFGEKIGTALANSLRALAGIETEDMTGSLPYQFGQAFVEGFTQAFKDFDWEAFFKSTVGTALSTIVGGIIGGPGGAGGAYVASKTGVNPIIGMLGGMAVWKGLGLILGRAAATGAAGAAGAGAAAAGGAGGIAAVIAALPVATIVALAATAAFAFWKTAKLKEEFDAKEREKTAQAGEAYNRYKVYEGTQPMGETVYGTNQFGPGQVHRPGGNIIPSDFGVSTTRKTDWEGLKNLDFTPVTRDMSSAAGDQLQAGRFFELTVRNFGMWVTRLPSALASGPVAGAATGTISGGRGGVTQNALGGSGTVYKPTMFLAGEAGPEDYSFHPRNGGASGGASGGGGGGGTVVHANINITEAGNAQQTAAYVVRELEKAVLNG